MLGFILSKMNLLILVTAMFAIIGFFTIGLTDLSEIREASNLVQRLRGKANSLANLSSTICFSDSYELPKEFYVAGGEYYYVLQISKVTVGEDLDESLLIFSVYPRTEIKKSYAITDYDYIPKAIAANSFKTKAKIYLYSQEYVYDAPANILDYSGAISEAIETDGIQQIFVDPQAAEVPANQLEFIREVNNGEASLHLIACNSPRCPADRGIIGESIHHSILNVVEGGFKC